MRFNLKSPGTLTSLLSFVALLSAYPRYPNDSSRINDHKIASCVRKAVRDADSTLLHTNKLNVWRDYLKIASADLELQLQPLVLIKFDEDQSFRTQLKTIIEWESQWRKKETEHYIYYYRWDQPPPEIILGVQDAHFNELVELFQIEPLEKIPFRYDLSVHKSVVYPYEDLRGGIVSDQPIDLRNGALAILYFISAAPTPFLEPLTRMYGSYFQNPSTSEAYYQKCLREISKGGYASIKSLFDKDHSQNTFHQNNSSSYAFIYQLDRQFGPEKIAEFLKIVHQGMAVQNMETHFQEIFGIDLSEFEKKFLLKGTGAADKF